MERKLRGICLCDQINNQTDRQMRNMQDNTIEKVKSSGHGTLLCSSAIQCHSGMGGKQKTTRTAFEQCRTYIGNHWRYIPGSPSVHAFCSIPCRDKIG
ncbi:unnamed protein product [Gongylonema pulchrum]|uniref:Uncharacterized protein n=1 Tax=Gongylonema pulchrum TaxID=637853 RepID=A0A183D9Q3_9BILA|nr:unnamed protein product [Gongylonema pulchrum]